MNIYVPSRSRPNMSTLGAIPSRYLPTTTLVLRADEAHMYLPLMKEYPMVKVHYLPSSVKSLARTRQYILEKAPSVRIVMLDDDITSFIVKPDIHKFGGLRTAGSAEATAIFETMLSLVAKEFVCVSTNDRLGLARPSRHIMTSPSRVGQVMFINRRKAVTRNYRFDRVHIYHDQDFALQICRNGDLTGSSNVYGHNMRPTYAPGGLATYRDQEIINHSAERLVAMHPGLVELTWKEKNGFKIPSRRINWAEAYKEGLKK